MTDTFLSSNCLSWRIRRIFGCALSSSLYYDAVIGLNCIALIVNWKGFGKKTSFRSRDIIIPVFSWRIWVNLQDSLFRISNVPVKTSSGLPRNAFVKWCRCLNLHIIYSVSTMLVVVENSPCNFDVITRSLVNFRLRNAGLKFCGSVSCCIQVTRRKIYLIN
jgi:hypothetical protein